MMKYIQRLNAVLADLERAGVIISDEKFKFCVSGMKVIEYVYNLNGRHPQTIKIIKILNWLKL
jgi:hypothetical protein